jgi:drug/metabolite transporter (DMT)-like permease
LLLYAVEDELQVIPQAIKVSTASTIYSFEFVVTILVAVALQKEVLETKEWVAASLAVAAIILYVM